MTSHEFAKQLLALPDLRICTPAVLAYDIDEDSGMPAPCAEVIDGDDTDGHPMKAVLISYRRETSVPLRNALCRHGARYIHHCDLCGR